MEKSHAVVNIAGQSFKLVCDESQDYINTIAAYVDGRVEEVQNAYPSLSTSNCVLLAALNISDELHKLRADYYALESRISELREMPRATAPTTQATPVKRPFESRQSTSIPTPTATK